jgi:hypothetical protein
MSKTLNERIAEYVAQRKAESETSISTAEIQREFAVSWTMACDILDALPNLVYNSYTYRYTIQNVKEEEQK